MECIIRPRRQDQSPSTCKKYMKAFLQDLLFPKLSTNLQNPMNSSKISDKPGAEQIHQTFKWIHCIIWANNKICPRKLRRPWSRTLRNTWLYVQHPIRVQNGKMMTRAIIIWHLIRGPMLKLMQRHLYNKTKNLNKNKW